MDLLLDVLKNRLIFSLLISLVLGFVVVDILYRFHKWDALKKFCDRAEPEDLAGLDSSWLVGAIERLFFMLIVAFDISGAAIAMIGWVTLKAVNTWHWPEDEESTERDKRRRLLFASILASIWSMGFALIGGLCLQGEIGMLYKNRIIWGGITFCSLIIYVSYLFFRNTR